MSSPPNPEGHPPLPPKSPPSSASQQVTAAADTAPPTTSTGTAASNTSDLDLSKESSDLMDVDKVKADQDLRNQVSALQKRMDASESLADLTQQNPRRFGKNILGMSARVLRSEREVTRG